MSNGLEVRTNDNPQVLDALKRIEKSLDCRFEKNDKLYIDRQTKYLIRSKVRSGDWKYIYDELYIQENISADILMSEIIKDSWLIQGNLNELDYKSYISPMLDCLNNNIFYEIIEDILNEKIDANKDFKYKLVEIYYNRIGMDKLKENIDKVNKYLFDERIANISINRIFDSNKTIKFKLECFSKIYEICKTLKLDTREKQICGKFKSLFEINNRESDIIIKFIFENYIEKNIDNEVFWLKVMNLNPKESIRFIEKYSARKGIDYGSSTCFDNLLLRSLFQGILQKYLTGQYSNLAYETLEKVWDNSRINPNINAECQRFYKKPSNNEYLPTRLKLAASRNKNYQGESSNSKKYINPSVLENMIYKSKLEIPEKSSGFIQELMELKLNKRKEQRLLSHINKFKFISNIETHIDFIIENLDTEHFDEFILALAHKSPDLGDKIYKKLINFCVINKYSKFKNRFELFLVEKNIKTKDTVVYLKNNNHDLFKQLYKRTI